MPQSRFLVIEGCNGVGKSTITEYLSDRTGASTFHYPPEFVSFRHDVHLDESVAPLPRLVYYLAATLHLSDLVRAQLKQSHVICDRYLASPLSLMIGESAIEESKEFFYKRQDASRRWAMRLGPVVELNTTNLSPEEMHNSALSLLVPKLNW